MQFNEANTRGHNNNEGTAMSDRGMLWLDEDGCIAYCNGCGWQKDYGTRDTDALIASRKHDCD